MAKESNIRGHQKCWKSYFYCAFSQFYFGQRSANMELRAETSRRSRVYNQSHKTRIIGAILTILNSDKNSSERAVVSASHWAQ